MPHARIRVVVLPPPRPRALVALVAFAAAPSGALDAASWAATGDSAVAYDAVDVSRFVAQQQRR
jgi:hypothetical protein